MKALQTLHGTSQRILIDYQIHVLQGGQITTNILQHPGKSGDLLPLKGKAYSTYLGRKQSVIRDQPGPVSALPWQFTWSKLIQPMGMSKMVSGTS